MAALEEVGHVEEGRAGRELGPQAGQVHAAGAPQRDGELGAVEDRADRRAEGVAQRGLGRGVVELVEHLLLAPAEQLGEDPVGDDGGEVDDGLGRQPLGQLERLVDRHLLRRRDDHHAGLRRVAEDVEHPAGLVAHQPDLHQLLDGLRRRELAGDVTGGDGVDDHEVVACAPAPPTGTCRW